MQKIILLLVFFSTHIIYCNNWYVSNIGKGDSTGSSWANAKYIGSLNGASVEAGDTVYIDGGTTSLTYSGDRSINSSAICEITGIGTSGNRIVYTRGKDVGHNGTPIFKNNGSTKYVFQFSGCSYAELSYVKVICDGKTAIRTSACNNVDIVHNEIDYTKRMAIHLNDTEHWRVMYNTITTDTTSIGLDYTQADAFKVNRGHGGEFAYNYVLNRSNIRYSDPAGQEHRDICQIYDMNNNATDTLKIHHNFYGVIYDYDNTATVNGLYITAGGGVHLIYNNIFSMRYNTMGHKIAKDTGLSGKCKVLMYNNIFVNRQSSLGCCNSIIFPYVDSIFFKNNIIKNENIGTVIEFTPSSGAGLYKDFSNNAYDIPSTYFSSTFGTFSQWQTAINSDWNSRIVHVSIIDSSSTDQADYKYIAGSEGIDDGVALTLFSDDYNGIERPVNGLWDIGAFEFGGNSSNNINVKSKIFLQGPFSSNSMSTYLSQNSLMPNSQPYNSPPWNYNGSENLSSGPNATMVDWVLVELRSASNPSQIIARRAAILKNTGLLLDTDGSECVAFNNVDPGYYYIVVSHRNHLAIMSAIPVSLSSNSTLYDFTTAMNKAFGQNPMIELVSGKFGMYAADANGNGVINTVDRDDVWLIQNGNIGYLESDFNMNSGVTVHDVNQLWNINNGAVTRVP